MRSLLVVLAHSASGCVGISDYERVRGELTATREENERLRDENTELHRGLVRATTKIDMIDAIIHEDAEVAGRPPRTYEGR